MNEEEKVKKQLVKNIIYTFITFSIVFFMLGTILYGQFAESVYEPADKELKEEIYNSNIVQIKKYGRKGLDEVRQKNPRLIYILRDANGLILENSRENQKLNEIFYNIAFNKNAINNIYEITLDNHYTYRAINYKLVDGNYYQILINVNSEKDILKQFSTTLLIMFFVSNILITCASYILSKKTLKPIIKSWKKQNQFVQDASHELRTPLAIIQAKQESLLENPESKIIDNAEDISITLKETQRLTKLIKELMEIARNDSNELIVNREKFCLDKEIEDIAILYNDLAKADNKKLLMDLNYKDEVFADINKIKELIIILLDNSFKYTEENNEISIITYKKDNKCTIEVTDTGIGISKEAKEHIFERFYREEKSRSREKGGMGLGLSIAYNIVKIHKGTIKVEDNTPKGTKMIVRIPIK